MANNSRTNRAFAKRIVMEDKQNPEKLKKIVAKLYEDALAGDKKAIDIIAERMDGKPVAEVHKGRRPVRREPGHTIEFPFLS